MRRLSYHQHSPRKGFRAPPSPQWVEAEISVKVGRVDPRGPLESSFLLPDLNPLPGFLQAPILVGAAQSPCWAEARDYALCDLLCSRAFARELPASSVSFTSSFTHSVSPLASAHTQHTSVPCHLQAWPVLPSHATAEEVERKGHPFFGVVVSRLSPEEETMITLEKEGSASFPHKAFPTKVAGAIHAC